MAAAHVRRLSPARHGAAIESTARGLLAWAPVGAGPMHRGRGGCALRLQGNLIRTDAEELTKLAKLGRLRHSPTTLPEVYRLGLDADLQGQLKLRQALFQSELSNGLHATSSNAREL